MWTSNCISNLVPFGLIWKQSIQWGKIASEILYLLSLQAKEHVHHMDIHYLVIHLFLNKMGMKVPLIY